MGFASWLTILFVALKLLGFIQWSWLWVLAPLWLGWFILIVFIVLGTILTGGK